MISAYGRAAMDFYDHHFFDKLEKLDWLGLDLASIRENDLVICAPASLNGATLLASGNSMSPSPPSHLGELMESARPGRGSGVET